MITLAGTAAPEGMCRLVAGSFAMGCEDFYPEEQPVRHVEVGGFWIDTHPVTVADFRRFVKATGYVTVAERPLDAAEYPDADPAALVPGIAGVPAAAWPGRPARLPQLVGLCTRRDVAAARGALQRDLYARATSRHAGRLRGRGGVCRLGGQGTSDRARVGIRGARRAGRRRLRVGRRIRPGGADDGQYMAGRVPVAEPHAATATPAPRRSARSRRTATACTT